MKKSLQPTVFVGVLVLLLTLMVLEADTKQNTKPSVSAQK